VHFGAVAVVVEGAAVVAVVVRTVVMWQLFDLRANPRTVGWRSCACMWRGRVSNARCPWRLRSHCPGYRFHSGTTQGLAPPDAPAELVAKLTADELAKLRSNVDDGRIELAHPEWAK
jgi:hypothetical protein